MAGRIFSTASFALIAWGVNIKAMDSPFVLTCENWNDSCPPAVTIVDCFVDSCLPDANGKKPCADDKECHMNHCGNCDLICCDPVTCNDDTFICPDGTMVELDPELGCTFPSCETSICDTQKLLCRDGYSTVSRDPENDCEFATCPETYKPTCASFAQPQDKCPVGVPRFDCLYDPCEDKQCADSDECISDTCGGCFAMCCSEADQFQFCTQDVKKCPDGSDVERDPSNECEFPECPVSTSSCESDTKRCDDGSSVRRNSEECCIFDSCAEDAPIVGTVTRMFCAVTPFLFTFVNAQFRLFAP